MKILKTILYTLLVFLTISSCRQPGKPIDPRIKMPETDTLTNISLKAETISREVMKPNYMLVQFTEEITTNSALNKLNTCYLTHYSKTNKNFYQYFLSYPIPDCDFFLNKISFRKRCELKTQILNKMRLKIKFIQFDFITNKPQSNLFKTSINI